VTNDYNSQLTKTVIIVADNKNIRRRSEMKRKTAINLIAITALALLFSWEVAYAQEEKQGEEKVQLAI